MDDIGLMVVVAQPTDATHAAVVRQRMPDITLMDLRLPDASGTDALISIRIECPEGPHPHADHVRQCRDSTFHVAHPCDGVSIGHLNMFFGFWS
jgi:CheY-like chemotaxis protein